jgi:hypothetical protein
MNALLKAAAAGAVGAITTNVAHELTRRIMPNAPRVDVLGMQALAKGLTATTGSTPTGDDLYRSTLVGDLLSNSAYFSAVGLGGGNAIVVGIGLGVLAGLGAVVLPPRMGLDEKPTARTPATEAMTVALYTVGGLAAGMTYQAIDAG